MNHVTANGMDTNVPVMTLSGTSHASVQHPIGKSNAQPRVFPFLSILVLPEWAEVITVRLPLPDGAFIIMYSKKYDQIRIM